MIDTHAHIDTEAFDEDRNDMLARAFDSGIEHIIIPNIESKHLNRVFELANSNGKISFASGIHPHYANEVNDTVLESVEKYSNKASCIAIGEIGLDYFYDFAKPEIQIAAFRDQLQIAKYRHLPVIVHNRESDVDLLKAIESEQDGTLNGVLHCFSSDLYTLERALDLNFCVSFTGNITFKKSTLNDVVKAVPSDRFMLETDSPYMSPVPFRGKRNEPANISYIAEKISEIKSISIEEVISMSSKTAKKLFNLALILMFIIPLSLANAQDETDEYEDEYSDEEIIEEELVHPYKKFLGLGPSFGSNTIVETFFLETGDDEISNPVLLATGGTISFGPLDNFSFEISYFYSKDTKDADFWNPKTEDPSKFLDPNIYQTIEGTVNWIINPYGRVNFYLSGGPTFFMHNRDNVKTNEIGFNAGLGLYINIPIDGAGLFVLTGGIKINNELGKSNVAILERNANQQIVTVVREQSVFLSITRASILWFPSFLN